MQRPDPTCILTLCVLNETFGRWPFEIFCTDFLRKFLGKNKKTGKNKKNIVDLFNAKFAYRALKVNFAILFLQFLALTLKVPITTAADDTFKYIFFYLFFLENKSWHFMWIIWQTIRMKFQGLFQKEIIILEFCLLQILLGALRYNNKDQDWHFSCFTTKT